MNVATEDLVVAVAIGYGIAEFSVPSARSSCVITSQATCCCMVPPTSISVSRIHKVKPHP